MTRLTKTVVVLLIIAGFFYAVATKLAEHRQTLKGNTGWEQFQQFGAELDPLIRQAWALDQAETFGHAELAQYGELLARMGTAVKRAQERRLLLYRPTGRQAWH